MNKIVYILLIMLCTSCALTYDVAPYKCELMLRGEQCLADHRCCNPPQTYHNTYPNYYNWWWKVNNQKYTNYVIVKPNNKPTYNGHRPTWNSNKPNRPNKNKNKKR